ncbi:hypothetical protein [Bizionia myxarmorum]|uniref:Lipoprotein n=1 Tax=Bizionia myxarmorum TaxID=291186 RepID=A0A5D0RDM7_9FLAO|nr:hypothetical protein [Bizionia myxarmorum]TYB78798.1 hypothetical protein ES674_03195 [Bizionia myxarmorum]
MHKRQYIKISNFLLIFFIVVFSCNAQESSLEKNLLKTYLTEYKKENKIDTIFLDSNNSNKELVERTERISLRDSSKIDDSILKLLTSQKEISNFRSQISIGDWSHNLKLPKVVLCDSVYIDRLHVSKPIYTINKKYALIYNYKINKSNVVFYLPIDVYSFKNDNWEKVFTIKDNGF